MNGGFEGTSKAAEGTATSVVFVRAKEEGRTVAIHWMDNDSSSALAVRQHYPETQLMLCGGHVTRAHAKALKKKFKKKELSEDDKKYLQKKYPKVDGAKCHCVKHHKSGCGCIPSNS